MLSQMSMACLDNVDALNAVGAFKLLDKDMRS